MGPIGVEECASRQNRGKVGVATAVADAMMKWWRLGVEEGRGSKRGEGIQYSKTLERMRMPSILCSSDKETPWLRHLLNLGIG